MPALSALVLLAGAAVASPASTPATCTAAQKAQRQAALTAFQKRMPAAKKAYFGHHRSVKLRKAFIVRQQARLKVLSRGASCTAPASTNPDAARMDLLVTYAGQMKALTFDPETSDAADEAIGTLASDEQDCADDPTLEGGHGALLLGRTLRQGRLAPGRSGLDRRSRRRRVSRYLTTTVNASTFA